MAVEQGLSKTEAGPRLTSTSVGVKQYYLAAIYSALFSLALIIKNMNINFLNNFFAYSA
jgi:hypothetical protein